jgi:endonuclease G
MKKILFAMLMAMCIFSVKAQDTVRLVHQNYTAVYSKSLHYPVLVEWWETKATVECPNQLPRKDQFAPDPLLVNDTKIQYEYDLANKVHKAGGLKGFDRGHMSPAASNECSGVKALAECFYFSNMAPQYHSLNAGDWKTLETLTRDLAKENDSVHVWAGSFGSSEKFNYLSIPTTCWKVVYIAKKKEYQAYLFANTPNKPTKLPSHKVTVEEITKLTGFKF